MCFSHNHVQQKLAGAKDLTNFISGQPEPSSQGINMFLHPKLELGGEESTVDGLPPGTWLGQERPMSWPVRQDPMQNWRCANL